MLTLYSEKVKWIYSYVTVSAVCICMHGCQHIAYVTAMITVQATFIIIIAINNSCCAGINTD